MKTLIEKIRSGAYFITGIDTDIGKSYVTGIIARDLSQAGRSVITQKLVQTGCDGISEDIITHRRIMGIELQPCDTDRTTCPEVFAYPASPHLAAEMEGRTLRLDKIEQSTSALLAQYDIVLIEGAGGLLSPLTWEITAADYIRSHRLPVIVVTSPRLGSINHTMLTIEACTQRGIEIAALVYHHYPTVADSSPIGDSTLQYLAKKIHQIGQNTIIHETYPVDHP